MPNYITAEGPSSELATGFLGAVCERPTGHTYPAPTEPARFEPFDPEITERAMRTAFGPVESHRPSLLRTIQELRAQLETARKIARRLYDNPYSSLTRSEAARYFAEISTEEKGGE